MQLIQQVVQQMQSGNLTAWNAIRYRLIPTPLVHHFACDIAARIALRKAQSHTVDRDFWEYLEVRRKWALGLLSMHTFNTTVESIRTQWSPPPNTETLKDILLTAMEKEPLLAAMRLWQMALNHYIAYTSSRATHSFDLSLPFDGWSSTNESAQKLHAAPEEAWLKRRLLWLCELWTVCGERTPWLLMEQQSPLPEPLDVALGAGLSSEEAIHHLPAPEPNDPS